MTLLYAVALVSFIALLFINQITLTQAEEEYKKVKIDVYYEVLCPDSIDFVKDQLYPTWQIMSELMDIHLIPFGKAHVVKKRDGSTEFTCQHGPRECQGNMVQSCAIHSFNNISQSLPFVDCMLKDRMPDKAGEKCAKQLSLPFDDIKTCYTSSLGVQEQERMGALTTGLNPPMNFVPWIIFDDVYNSKFHYRSLRDLYGVMCEISAAKISKYRCLFKRHSLD